MSTYQHERVIYYVGALTMDAVAPLILQLLTLNDDSGEAAHLYVTSPGGEALAAQALTDVMGHMAIPVHTYAVGLCASAALFVIAAGEKGSRYALPSAWLMFHGGVTSAEGRLTELEARADHHRKVNDNLLERLAENTGKRVIYWRRKTSGEAWYSAQEAVAAGIVDHVLTPEVRRNE